MAKRTDAELLTMLEMRDAGWTMLAIGKAFKKSRNAISGILHRIDRETEASEHDGTMPEGWWKAGLANRSGER